MEIAGGPLLPPREVGRLLAQRLPPGGDSGGPAPRVIRVEGPRALVQVEHLAVARARRAWNGPLPELAPGASLRTHRSWGTLRRGKAWLRRRPRGAQAASSPPSSLPSRAGRQAKEPPRG